MKINSFSHKLMKFWKILLLLKKNQMNKNKKEKRREKDSKSKRNLNTKRKKKKETVLQCLPKQPMKVFQPIGSL